MNGKVFEDKIAAIQKVEEIGAAYGIGRDMHVGDTIIGIKGRVGFEAAAPMLIIGAHRFLEKYTLSKWQQYWKDQVANWYGMFLHESQYLEPVMRDIEAMLQESQRNVNGTVILELRPLSFSTVGVDSKDDLVKTKFGEYGEMQKGWTAEDAKGFIDCAGIESPGLTSAPAIGEMIAQILKEKMNLEEKEDFIATRKGIESSGRRDYICEQYEQCRQQDHGRA